MSAPSPRPDGVFERFTERARQVVVLAQEEARTLKHNYIGTEHILLGLLREEEGLAARVLESFDVTVERVRALVVRIVGSGEQVVAGQIPFTERAKNVVRDLALGETLSLGHKYIGTEHLLLALVREDEGLAVRILLDFDVDADKVRNEVIRLLSDPGPRRQGRSSARAATVREGHSTTPPAPAQAGPAVAEAASAPSELEAVPTHADRPARKDEIGRRRLAEVLGERIRRVRGEDTEQPVRTRAERSSKLRRDRASASQTESFMVHIHAPWGAGKSSVLSFLAEDLRNLKPPTRFGRRRVADERLSQWIVADFNAWQHQRLEPPWWWLLSVVDRACRRELWRIDRGRWAWFRVRNAAWHLWNLRAALISVLLAIASIVLAATQDWFGLEGSSLATLGTAAVSATALIAFGTLLWASISGASRWLAFGSSAGAVKFLKRAHDPLGAYRRRFRWLTQSAGHPVAVFIDDLDRCRPTYVVQLLEGIQTLFVKEAVAYVVAADRRWLCQCFATEYDDLKDAVNTPGRPLGFLFLEKTFQISMEIPPMSSEVRRDYWGRLMSAAPTSAQQTVAPDPSLSKEFDLVRTEQDVERRIKALIKDGAGEEEVRRAAVRRLNAPALQAQLKGLLEEFAPLLENNPRAMKRLVNAYGIERDRLVRERRLLSLTERKQLVLFTILRLRWPLFAERLLEHPDDVALLTGDSKATPSDHPFTTLLVDGEVRSLFNGSSVDVKLDADFFRRYSGHEPEPPPSVGA